MMVLIGLCGAGYAWFTYGSAHPCVVLQERIEQRGQRNIEGANILEQAAETFTNKIAQSAAERAVAGLTPRECVSKLVEDLSEHGI